MAHLPSLPAVPAKDQPGNVLFVVSRSVSVERQNQIEASIEGAFLGATQKRHLVAFCNETPASIERARKHVDGKCRVSHRPMLEPKAARGLTQIQRASKISIRWANEPKALDGRT